jgi:hypothetical protein
MRILLAKGCSLQYPDSKMAQEHHHHKMVGVPVVG